MAIITVDGKNLYSKTEFCKKKRISRPTLDIKIKEGEVRVINFKGGVSVIDDGQNFK
jgi:benzoyl-CoA reductase/2-hydroxyglutaryl-CoA dehydratase subunit BcrC/BadD/HgdB